MILDDGSKQNLDIYTVKEIAVKFKMSMTILSRIRKTTNN